MALSTAELFKKAKKILTKDVADLMGERFDQRKRVVMAALMPLDVKEAAKA